MNIFNKNVNRHQRFSAFTLAEVLITLGIIGIIAALTIPAIISNTQKQEFISKLKKNYSVINSGFSNYALDNNCYGDLKCLDIFANGASSTSWSNFVNNYFKIAKDCGISTAGNECFPAESYLRGMSGNFSTTNFYEAVLNDGTIIGFANGNNNCTTFDTITPSNPLYDICGALIIDINGQTPPNTFGRDFFYISISRLHGVVSGWGSQAYADATGNSTDYWRNGSFFGCPDTGNSRGYGCFARIIEEGWQMLY